MAADKFDEMATNLYVTWVADRDCDDCTYVTAAERTVLLRAIAALVRRAVEEARAEEREACMKDVCPSCRAEMPLEGGSQFQHVRKDWYEVNYCKAERIRARGSKEGR